MSLEILNTIVQFVKSDRKSLSLWYNVSIGDWQVQWCWTQTESIYGKFANAMCQFDKKKPVDYGEIRTSEVSPNAN